MSAFHSDLVYLPSQREGFFVLVEPLVYCSDLTESCIVVASGFETNFVTGRKLLVVRRIVQDEMNAAAVIHDQLYGDGSVPREVADDIFHEAMLVLGVARWRAWAAWCAVRVFGGKFYNQQDEKKAA